MEHKQLNAIITWIINRKCKKDDNIHIKRAVKKSKSVILITELEIEDLVDRLTNEVMNSSGKYLNSLEHPFPYISKVIYDSALPKLQENFIQEYIQKQEDA